jgi:U3 small nucleolar RNA-associated protein 22
MPHYRDYDASKDDNKIFPVVDFDPVEMFVRDLRSAYGEVAMFFYDSFGATRIYVLWRPDALKKYKQIDLISTVCYRLVDNQSTNDKKSNQLYELDVQEILKDFNKIGKDLVESITIKSDSSILK